MRRKPLNSDISISPSGRPFLKPEAVLRRLLDRPRRLIPMKELWEILVPKSNGLEDIDISVHNIWDGRVRRITGGLTIHRSALGNWISPAGELVVERMIPVRIACTTEEIHEIGHMTKEFYRQEKVMYYKVSDEVYII
jgi:hypothetical protein